MRQIQMMPIGEVHPYPDNPRKNDDAVDAVATSLKEYGWQQPIVVDKDNVIIVGHTRREAAKKLGMKEVPVIVADNLTEAQAKAYRLADNKTGELSDWDFDLLSQELESLKDMDYDISLAGFDDTDIHLPTDEAVDDDFDEEPPEDPITQPGDIWLLGRHRLMCGDSTQPDDIETLMGGVQADLYLTDPPYNVDYVGKTADALKIQNDSMSDDAFQQFLDDAFFAAKNVMKGGATFYIWHADSKGYEFRKACRDVGWEVRECLIWAKNSMVLGGQDYQWQHEPCQPAGTMVWTPSGQVPIERLKDGDRVISFDTYSGTVKGYKEGLEVKTASRHYKGVMYGVYAGGNVTRATDNHQFSVRFNPDTSEVYCTYLMRRGSWWRVGITRTYDARGFGLKHRLEQEKGEEGWLIQTFKSKGDAQVGEQYLACEYGIPYTYWESRELNDGFNYRTSEQIDWLYKNLDLDKMEKNAERLLADYGRSIRFPLVTPENHNEKFSRRVTAKINACNLVPNLMQVPIPKEHYEGADTFSWEPISDVTREDFNDTVYSLAVDKYHHYIADGIVTHNCLFGWNDGGSHAWYSDRKQTTLLKFDRPTKSKYHPTMKPIPLFDYLIQNSSKAGDIVLDSFGGSGTTIMACEQDGRTGYVNEIDPRYCDVILDRYIAFKGDDSDVFRLNPDGSKTPYSELKKD